MTNSLQDQLVKAGLADRSQINKANKAKHKKAKQRRSQKQQPDEQAMLAQQTRQQKIARDRDLNRQMVERQKRNAATAEIKQLLETQAVTDAEGEISFNFQHKRKIKQLSVSEAVHGKLVAGRLGIVHFEGEYHLASPDAIAKVGQRDANLFTFRVEPDAQSEADGEYAEYQVPDDLRW